MRVILEEKVEDRHFIASFTGSSNTAGHGGYGKHAYPLLVNHVAKDTFERVKKSYTKKLGHAATVKKIKKLEQRV